MQHSGHTSQIFQNELIVGIYSKSLVRAIVKVLLMKFSQNIACQSGTPRSTFL